MVVKQVATLVNEAMKVATGDENISTVDLQDAQVIDAGSNVLTSATAKDNFVNKLVDRIGRTWIRLRDYTSELPNMLWDKLDYGTVIQVIKYNMPDAQDTQDWQLQDGQVYEQNRFYAPSVEAKYYNDKITFTIPYSITDLQLREAFTSAAALGSFVSGLYLVVKNAMTKRVETLVKDVLLNLIGETIYDDYQGASLSASSKTKAVNLLYLYNTAYSTSLTADVAITTPDFIRFACYMLKLYNSRIGAMSKAYNIEGRTTWTPADQRELAMLSEFKTGADVYLQSQTFHNELTALPTAQEVTYWQGTGTTFDFANTSKIDVKTSEGHTVTTSGIIAVLYDKWSCGVCNYDHRVTTHRNDVAEFTNYWDKQDLHLFNDFGENCVVFFLA